MLGDWQICQINRINFHTCSTTTLYSIFIIILNSHTYINKYNNISHKTYCTYPKSGIGAEAFARAFDRVGAASGFGLDPFAELRAEIERWRNHFADLDSDAEALADELRLGAGDLYNAIAERLRVKHQLAASDGGGLVSLV